MPLGCIWTAVKAWDCNKALVDSGHNIITPLEILQNAGRHVIRGRVIDVSLGCISRTFHFWSSHYVGCHYADLLTVENQGQCWRREGVILPAAWTSSSAPQGTTTFGYIQLISEKPGLAINAILQKTASKININVADFQNFIGQPMNKSQARP